MEEKAKHHPPLLIFVTMFFAAIALLAVCLFFKHTETGHLTYVETTTLIGEHLASAVIVASFMGITYEWFVHAKVTKTFELLLTTHQEAIARAMQDQESEFERVINSLRATNAQDVFTLLHDIAEHQKAVPTLYYPARDKTNEFVFSTHRPFFERLISARDGREQVIDALKMWTDPKSSLNVRFLGSDFVGLLALGELAQDLRDVVAEKAPGWASLRDEAERSCLLNYIWAASRCEEPMYTQLQDLLMKTKEEFVQHWILFVPQQMQDHHLAEMVDAFLTEKGGEISCDVVKSAVSAIGAIHRSGINMQPVLEKHRTVIERCKLAHQADEEMTALPVARPRRRLFGRREV